MHLLLLLAQKLNHLLLAIIGLLLRFDTCPPPPLFTLSLFLIMRSVGALFCTHCPVILFQLLFYWNVAMSSNQQNQPLPPLLVLCQFSSYISQHNPTTLPILHPLPSGVLFLHSTESATRSPLFSFLRANQSAAPRPECMITVHSLSDDDDGTAHLYQSSKFSSLLRSKLLLMECSTEEEDDEASLGFRHCFRLLRRISQLRLADGIVPRRLFVVLLVYERSRTFSTKLRNALLEQQQQSTLPLFKTHVLIISFRYLKKKEKEKEAILITLNQVTFIGALQNACTVVSGDRKYLTFSELTLTLLFRWLLARDEAGRVIRCDFQGRLLKAVVTQVNLSALLIKLV